MSKRFKRQDYFRYKRLGKKWRRPVGWQSKLRLKKGGAGLLVSVGYGTPGKMQPTLVRSLKDLEKASKYGIIIAASVGSKKTTFIAARAKELGLTVLNMKKIHKAERVAKDISKKKKETKKEKKHVEVKAEEHKHTHEEHVHKEGEHVHGGHGHEKKMGFHEDVVSQVFEGKTKTYRLRDHNLHVNDEIALENTQKGETFGRAKITNIERVPVSKINLKDPEHHKTYDRVDELIDALKRHNPDRKITPETEVLIYTYKFTPTESGKREKS